MTSNPNEIIVPAEEKARQAISALKGYRYQLYQTLLQWVSLDVGATLLVEVAEDFAVVAGSALNLVQVKETKATGTLTLNVPDVAKFLNSFWSFRTQNPAKHVTAVYLTTSIVGKEQNANFPNRASGIDYWRDVAKDNADTKALRDYLKKLSLSAELVNFIENSSDDDFRNQLVRPIRWACGQNDIAELDRMIRDRLIDLGQPKGANAADAERAMGALLAAAFDTMCMPLQKQRTLNSASLHRIFDGATSQTIQSGLLRRLADMATKDGGDILSPASVHTIPVTDYPLPLPLAKRETVVAEIEAALSSNGAVWLHGSSGLGKTSLAAMAARRNPNEWLIADLRDCKLSELPVRLATIRAKFFLGKFRNVIFDDFPAEACAKVPLQLATLCAHIRARDGSVMFASYRAPAEAFGASTGFANIKSIEVPYLTEDEVSALVSLAGGDPKRWTKVIHVFCGFGHPQLTIARIRGLQQRDWPESDRAEGLTQDFTPPKDVTEQKDTVRRGLVEVLTDQQRPYLYALSLNIGYFDRGVALAIGEHLGVKAPGDAFDFLVGPWIEQVGKGNFRLSPLVNDVGAKNLSNSEKEKVHNAIIDHLLKARPFPAYQFPHLITYALVTKRGDALQWAAMAIVYNKYNKPNVFPRLAEECSILSAFNTNNWLFAENKKISALLRYAQFLVAIESGEYKTVWGIYSRLVLEVETVDELALRGTFLYSATAIMLSDRACALRPSLWVPALLKMEEYKKNIEKLAEEGNIPPPDDGIGTHGQVLFDLRATDLRGVDELLELFTILDAMSDEQRSHYLLNLDQNEIGLMVGSAWLATANAKAINEATDGQLEQCEALSEKWGNSPLIVECGVARAILQDEYQSKPELALQLLAQLEEKHGANYRIGRQRQKILYRKGDHEQSLSVVEGMVETIPKECTVELAFAHREAAISAALLGENSKALNHFTKAGLSASQCTESMAPMVAGCTGDRAMIAFQAGDREGSLRLLLEAFRQCDAIPKADDIRVKWCRIALGQLVIWMRNKATPLGWRVSELTMRPGWCSNQEPSELIKDKAVPHDLVKWYELVCLERDIDLDVGCSASLAELTRKGDVVPSKMFLELSKMQATVRAASVSRFFQELPSYISTLVHISRPGRDVNEDDLSNPKLVIIPQIPEAEWLQEPVCSYLKNSVLAFIVFCLVNGDIAAIRVMCERLATFSAGSAPLVPPYLSDFINSGHKTHEDVISAAALSIWNLKLGRDPIIPSQALYITANLWSWLRQCDYQRLLLPVLGAAISEMWKELIQNRPFLFKWPMGSIPPLMEILNQPITEMAQIAELSLKAQAGAGVYLPDWLAAAMKG